MRTSRRRTRFNREPERNPRILLLGGAAAALAGLVLYLAAHSAVSLPGRSYYTLHVQFTARGGSPVLPPPGSDVRIAGEYVGQTRTAQLENGVATLDLQLRGDAGPLPADSRFAVRAQGLLGAKYVDVRPGRGIRTLGSGSLVAPARSSIATSLSEVLQSFDAEPRADLGRFIRGFGGGLAGRGGALNDALDQLAPAFHAFSHALAPTLRDQRLPALVRSAHAFAAVFVPVRSALSEVFAPANRALTAFARARPDVVALLDHGPAQLDGTRKALAASDSVLAHAQRFARATTAFTAGAPHALRLTTTLLREGRPGLRALPGILALGRQAVSPTLRLTGALSPALPRLRDILELSREPVRTIGAYGCDIARFGRTWRSFLGYAPAGQTGSLGPLAILRTTLAGGGLPAAPNNTPGAGLDGDINPCEPVLRPK